MSPSPSRDTVPVDVSAAEQIAAQITQRVLRLDLYPGARLREAEIAADYSVARHTARTAIRLLVANGLATHDRHRGAEIRSVGPDDVDDIFRLRFVLEAGAIDIICDTAADLDAIAGALDMLERLERLELASPASGTMLSPSLEADLAFHRAIVSASKSSRLLTAFDNATTELRFTFVLVNAHEMPYDAAEHRQLFGYLADRDVEAAQTLLKHHIDDGRMFCRTILEQRHLPFTTGRTSGAG